jgi:hypothetical protein
MPVRERVARAVLDVALDVALERRGASQDRPASLAFGRGSEVARSLEPAQGEPCEARVASEAWWRRRPRQNRRKPTVITYYILSAHKRVAPIVAPACRLPQRVRLPKSRLQAVRAF